MNRGNRLFYDQDGKIIFQTGEASGKGVNPHKEIASLNYIDLEFGAVDTSKYSISSIDTVNKMPILEEIPQTLTEEQQRILELENELLIASGVI